MRVHRLVVLIALVALLITGLSQAALAAAPAGASSAADQAVAAAQQSLQDEYDLLITGKSARPLIGHVSEFGDVQTGAQRTESSLRRRSFDARDGLRFVNARVRLTDVTVELSAASMIVRATEWYELGFESDRYAYQAGRTVTKGRIGHAFTFALHAGRWVLEYDESEHHQSQTPISPDRTSMPTPKPAQPAPPISDVNPGSAGHLASPSFSGYYDWSAAGHYADQYALSYNPAYRSWPNDDCTNFISQALAAGGWVQLGGLYNDWSKWAYGSGGQTQTWVNVDAMLSFMQTSGRAQFKPYLTDMLIGDIIQVIGSIHHSMIVDDRWGGYLDQIFVDYHSTDTYHRSLQDFLNAEAALGHSNNYYAEHIVGTY